ncbi:CppA family protein [Streptococcus didelphis]|uniref:CppA family protein n=1 Tax=Streptococcus didelphis TaxID=102886 RepID=A0ABY9LIP8_9STRE|nr:CppA N-terminal domain-containing protein [Streptococcus didelphis]WMB28722.1 CppA family protein [Streptococcus didelphis]WMB29379.1 CppA family protein [Streptococcus didelphis]
MTLLKDAVFGTPVLRVNNRQLNIDFYQKSLGFKLVYEENAIAVFTSCEAKKERFVIEESPATRTRAVEGPKKVNTIIVKTSSPWAIEQLLAHGAQADTVFIGKKGYAYQVTSPEGDCFLLHAEDDVAQLEVTDLPELEAEADFLGLPDFTFEKISLNVSDQDKARNFYQDLFDKEFPLELDFIQAQGPDLAIAPHMTWDLEILEVLVPKDYDLAELKVRLEEKGQEIYLDKKETILVLSDLSNIEIWFMK